MANQSSSKSIIIIVILIILACCCVISILAITGIFLFTPNIFPDPTATQQGITPTTTQTPFIQITPLTQVLDPIGAQESLETLLSEIVPVNDPIDLAARLQGKLNIPATLPDPNMPYEVGDKKTFWVSNTDTTDNFQVTAVLRYIGDHVYFWIEDGVQYKNSDLQDLAKTFDKEIYPINQEFFGQEWLPGVDNDPRLYILYCGGVGDSTAGYFSSADELHPDAHMYSNAHEMFIINSDTVGLDEDYIYGTLAHEFQHMIHWYQDRNEETWINEGFSMLAELINEYDTGGFDYLYSMNPDMQLTDWGTDVGENGNHYGASFLFMTYFMDRFGENATKDFVAHPENGLASIDAVMNELNLNNPDTGEPYTGVEVFSDWAVSNYVLDSKVEDGRYNYESYSPYKVNPSDEVTTCPSQVISDVYQFGVDYIEFDCAGEQTITLNGMQQVGLIPINAYSGSYFYWSNMGDESNMRLTREFDLTNVATPIFLTYQVWYDLEEDYDYLYLSGTTDNVTWQIMNTPSCTTTNPSGNSYGCGYNGSSNGWKEEKVDLSQFAGQKVTLQFDYVTDAAVNGIGLFLDDIRLDALDYYTDLEQDDGGWNAEGFVRIMNALPQTYSVSLIEIGNNTLVKHLTLDELNSIQIDVTIGGDIEKVVLVISGTTPYTRQKAEYRIDIK
jgi:immune inhibitor A